MRPKGERQTHTDTYTGIDTELQRVTERQTDRMKDMEQEQHARKRALGCPVGVFHTQAEYWDICILRALHSSYISSRTWKK